MTFKQTHTSADGQERRCTAEPGRCPVNPTEPHNLTLDGEKLTPKQEEQIISLYSNHKHVMPGEPETNYLKNVNKFFDQYLTVTENNEFVLTIDGDKTAFQLEAIQHPLTTDTQLTSLYLELLDKEEYDNPVLIELSNILDQHTQMDLIRTHKWKQIDKLIDEGMPTNLAASLTGFATAPPPEAIYYYSRHSDISTLPHKVLSGVIAKNNPHVFSNQERLMRFLNDDGLGKAPDLLHNPAFSKLSSREVEELVTDPNFPGHPEMFSSSHLIDNSPTIRENIHKNINSFRFSYLVGLAQNRSLNKYPEIINYLTTIKNNRVILGLLENPAIFIQQPNATRRLLGQQTPYPKLNEILRGELDPPKANALSANPIIGTRPDLVKKIVEQQPQNEEAIINLMANPSTQKYLPQELTQEYLKKRTTQNRLTTDYRALKNNPDYIKTIIENPADSRILVQLAQNPVIKDYPEVFNKLTKMDDPAIESGLAQNPIIFDHPEILNKLTRRGCYDLLLKNPSIYRHKELAKELYVKAGDGIRNIVNPWIMFLD